MLFEKGQKDTNFNWEDMKDDLLGLRRKVIFDSVILVKKLRDQMNNKELLKMVSRTTWHNIANSGSTTIRTKDEFGPKIRFGPKTNSDPILKFGPNYFAN